MSLTETTRPPRPDVAVPSVVQVIEPPRNWTGINWAEIWRFRELLYFLTWRDIKVRYKQTALGVFWTVLQPLLMMAVFSIIFGRLSRLSDAIPGVPYPVFVFTGLLPWTFFLNSVTNSSNSLVGSSNLITKVYFPRLIIPFAAVGAGLLNLAVSFIVLLLLLAGYRIAPTWQMLLLPLFIFATLLAATGVGTLFSALTVGFRDFGYVLPFILQVWMFITPVIYPPTIVPPEWQWLLAINPMSGIIGGFRGAFLGLPLDWPQIGLSMLISMALFLIGAGYFRKVERQFADVI